jgi:hypothetical protein
MTTSPRQPAGTSEGGRFATDHRDRPAVRLDEGADGGIVVDMGTAIDDEAYNATGTYAHPPIPRNAQQVIKFWITTTIPDRVLERVAEAYVLRNLARRASADQASRGLGNLLKRNRDQATLSQQLAERQPEDAIPDHLLTDIVRLGLMFRQANALPEDECQRLSNAQFTLNAGDVHTTPYEVWVKYELEEIEGAFEDDTERQRELREWNIHADLTTIANTLDGKARPPEWRPLGGMVE